MKRMLQTLSAAVVSVAFVGSMTQMAGAASCDSNIHITGPGSNNIIDCEEIVDVSYTCDNDILTVNVTTQEGQSGTATNTYNTSSGNAITGSVQNDNNTTTDLSTACGPDSAVATPTSTDTPETPGRGAAGGQGQFIPPELPNTSAGISPLLVTIGGIITASVAAVARFGLGIYRRLGAK